VPQIAGYRHGPLVDGSNFLDEPLFWPCHLSSSLCGEEAQAIAFGPDWDAAQDIGRAVSNPERWPVFTVVLPAGYEIYVVYRNFDGDMGVDYLISHPGWSEAVTLAVDDGHFTGPGLSWRELEAAAGRATVGGVTDPDGCLLLLFPMLGDADVPEDAAGRLASALAARTIVEDPAELAFVLLNHQGQWEPARWSRSGGVWVCDGAHSVRNPLNIVALPATKRAEISGALNKP
jgi:hypothetical protein